MTAEAQESVQIQKEEVEVLESIYLDDIKLIKASFPYKLEVICKPFSVGQDVNENSFNLKVIIDFVKNYPLSAKPRIAYEPISDITQDQIAEIELLTTKILSRNSDLPVVFEIVESVREWIQINIIDLVVAERTKKQEKAKIIYHRPTFETYTPCTLENFLKWKASFDEDMAKLKFKTIKEDETKLNGRQFFLKNKDQPIKEPEDEDDEEEEEDNEDEEDSDYNEVESDDDDQKPFK